MMDREHKRTGTWGPSRGAKAERAKITEMLRRDDFGRALEAGIKDVRSIAGNRYDSAIAEATRYYSTWRPQMPNPAASAWPGGAPTADPQSNVTELVARLTRYLDVLDRHTLAIQQAYDQACGSLANLQRVWGGEAAHEFYTRFGGTTEALERYLAGARGMREILEERLTSLRQADRPG